MIAMILVLELLAIAANLALPFMQDISLHNRATTIAHEMKQVRDAAVRSRSGRTEWPVPAVPGEMPTEIVALLPHEFALTHEDYRLVWERWSLADGSKLGLSTNEVAGVTVISEDPRLAAMVAREFGRGEMRLSLADRTTLLIEGAPTLLR